MMEWWDKCDIFNFLGSKAALVEMDKLLEIVYMWFVAVPPRYDPCPLHAACNSYLRPVSTQLLQECAIAWEEVIASHTPS